MQTNVLALQDMLKMTWKLNCTYKHIIYIIKYVLNILYMSIMYSTTSFTTAQTYVGMIQQQIVECRLRDKFRPQTFASPMPTTCWFKPDHSSEKLYLFIKGHCWKYPKLQFAPFQAPTRFIPFFCSKVDGVKLDSLNVCLIENLNGRSQKVLSYGTCAS